MPSFFLTASIGVLQSEFVEIRSPWDTVDLDLMGWSPMQALDLRGYYVFWGNVRGSFRAVVTSVAFLAFIWTPGSQASGLTCSWSGPEEFLISSLVRRVPKVSQSLHPGWGPCDPPRKRERMAFHFCSTSLPRSHLGQSGICKKLWENPDPSQTQKRGIVEGLLNGLPVAPMMVRVYEEKGPEKEVKTNRWPPNWVRKWLTTCHIHLCSWLHSSDVNLLYWGQLEGPSSVLGSHLGSSLWSLVSLDQGAKGCPVSQLLAFIASSLRFIPTGALLCPMARLATNVTFVFFWAVNSGYSWGQLDPLGQPSFGHVLIPSFFPSPRPWPQSLGHGYRRLRFCSLVTKVTFRSSISFYNLSLISGADLTCPS